MKCTKYILIYFSWIGWLWWAFKGWWFLISTDVSVRLSPSMAFNVFFGTLVAISRSSNPKKDCSIRFLYNMFICASHKKPCTFRCLRLIFARWHTNLRAFSGSLRVFKTFQKLQRHKLHCRQHPWRTQNQDLHVWSSWRHRYCSNNSSVRGVHSTVTILHAFWPEACGLVT